MSEKYEKESKVKLRAKIEKCRQIIGAVGIN
jgi:hypothetical protein